MSIRHSHTSGLVSQRSPSPSFTSVARPLPPSHRSAPPETAREEIYQWSTSIPSGVPTESDTRSTMEIDTISDSPEPAQDPKQYVYYTVFTRDGAIPCKHTADRQDPFLGRIEARRITPPHTVESMIRCICNIEGDSRHQYSQLFLSVSSARPMDRQERVAILTGSGPGSDPRQPLALVLLDGSDADAYSKTIVAVSDWAWGSDDANWLSYKKGEVLYTDGVIRVEKYKGKSHPTEYYTYRARNANGQYGFVDIPNFSDPK